MVLKKDEQITEDIPDEQLMVRIGDGDRTAYKMLVDRHLPGFLVFSSRLLDNRAEAEDVMQEAFIRVWKTAVKWDSGRNARFTTWFYRVVVNLVIDVKRKRKTHTGLEELSDIPGEGLLADVVLSDRQKAAAIAEVMGELPKRQRLALTLCYLQGQGNKEAAEIMDISVKAVESLLVRGRIRMAELLKEQKEELLQEII